MNANFAVGPVIGNKDIVAARIWGVAPTHWMEDRQRPAAPSRIAVKKKAGQMTGRKVFRRGCLKGPILVHRSSALGNCNVGKYSCSKRNRHR